MEKEIKYSVIIPVFNEKDTINELCSRIDAVFKSIKSGYEIIFIDDGSRDGSLEIIEEINKKNKMVKAISFRTNSGKSIALTCGFAHATGDVVFTMDGDLQDQPEEMPKFIDKLNEGYDLVSGWKRKRYDPVLFVAASRIFNFFTSFMTRVKLHDFNCGFKAYKKDVVKNLELHGDLFRFIPAIAKWQGFKVGEIEVTHSARKYGKSKYGADMLVRGFFDLFTVVFLTRYVKRPLHFFGFTGIIFFISGLAIDIYLTAIWFMGEKLFNRPLLTLGTLLMIVGFQLFSTGFLAEMIANYNAKLDKNFPVNKKVGL